MINPAQVHLALNHFPIIGMLIGLFILASSFLTRHSVVRSTGLVVLAVSALSLLPVFFSGEPAEDVIKNRPGIEKSIIHDHEEAAELGLVFTAITGLFAATALGLSFSKKTNHLKKAALATLLAAFISSALLIRTGHLGGLIRHDELRTNTNDHSHLTE